jgi:nucleotide-binding universal stress UspA family protein
MNCLSGNEAMVTRLLVPLDGSLLAEAALPVTNQLAHKLDVPVTLVHLLERNAPQQIHGDRHLSDPVEAERYLCDVRRRMFSADPQVGHHVHRMQINNVSQAIVEHAIEMSSDLIVMCTHGPPDMRTLFFGSIAQQVAASGAAPVLAIRARAVSSAQTLGSEPLLFCLDNTTFDESTFTLVGKLAKLYHKSLHLLAVVPTLGSLSGGEGASRLFLPLTTKQMLELDYCAMSEYLARHIALLQAHDLRVSGEALRGNPVETLAQTAQRIGAGLIALGVRGKDCLPLFRGDTIPRMVYSCGHLPLLLVPRLATQKRKEAR